MTSRLKRWTALPAILALLLVAAGCRDDGGGIGILMGGSIQGAELDLDGAVTTLAGLALTWGHDDGTGDAAGFYYPIGVTTDGTNLYVTDALNYTIREID